ncbi:uncharacterized protein A1O5_12689 [Cladophialophora psammophila CBS 110553]|uniref:Uncharacterized protein n=1 Tax=Cladophialophora psammophila CBS 110553 TaxID=1182543 RepID=W9VL40_9EURO|nr:uncharacterized protein A1O5_12689 [Cladophialophora psammophila CBS 110553]EXJ56233.1 hypothetical protein A1O5_12689 [Cladophialophora psammophila CBS 110553]
MPSTQGFEIAVEGADGVPFATYGTKSLSGGIISMKIQAKNGVTFRIRVKPQFPFPEPNDVPQSQSRYKLRPSTQHAAGSDTRDAMDCESSKTIGKTNDPVCYIAYVFIDGNKTAECTGIIVVDPKCSAYSAKGCVLDGRCSLLDDSEIQNHSEHDLAPNMSVCPWVFTERGIDVLLSRMDISKADPDIPSTKMEQEVADLTQAMADDNLTPAKGKRGEIEVRIVRAVHVARMSPDSYWKRKEEGGPRSDDDKTHDVTLARDKEEHVRMIGIKYRRYRRDEAFLCKVIFQYMDIAKLVTLGLCTTDGKPIEHRPGRTNGGPLAMLSSSLDSQLSPLKRVRYLEPEQGRSGESELDKSQSSEEENSAADTMSDSDVPLLKRRGAIRRRKAMTLSEEKVLGRKDPATVDSPAHSFSEVSKFEGKAEGSDWLQLHPTPKEGSEAEGGNGQLQLGRASIEEEEVGGRDVEQTSMD